MVGKRSRDSSMTSPAAFTILHVQPVRAGVERATTCMGTPPPGRPRYGTPKSARFPALLALCVNRADWHAILPVHELRTRRPLPDATRDRQSRARDAGAGTMGLP